MTLLALLTPRAGRWNHRYLVSRPGFRDEKILDHLFLRSREGSDGDDLLVVRRMVFQPTTGRRGEEILLLQDARLSRMMPEQREVMQSKLRDFSETDAERLVASMIDWDADGQDAILYREELEEQARLYDKELDGLVDASWSVGARGRKGMVAIVLVVALGGAGAWINNWVSWSSSPLPQSLCRMLEKERGCRVNPQEKAYLRLCAFLEASSCEPVVLEERLEWLKAQDCDADSFPLLFRHYREEDRLDWTSLFGEAPSAEEERHLLNELSIHVVGGHATLGDYCTAKERARLLSEFLNGKLPTICRDSLLPSGNASGLADKVEAARAFLQIVKRDRKHPCVVPGVSPLEQCALQDDAPLFDQLAACRPEIDDIKVAELQEKGYEEEAQLLDATLWLFNRAGQ
jgi:hypothetical protein